MYLGAAGLHNEDNRTVNLLGFRCKFSVVVKRLLCIRVCRVSASILRIHAFHHEQHRHRAQPEQEWGAETHRESLELGRCHVRNGQSGKQPGAGKEHGLRIAFHVVTPVRH